MAKKLNVVIDEMRWRFEELEQRMSFVMGVRARLSRGIGVSKDELKECMYILDETKYYG